MPDITRAILGSRVKRRKSTPPPVQPRRALPHAAWAAAPATAPAVAEREAVRARWQPPPKAEADTIRALLVDPEKRTVTEIRLPTEPGDPKRGYGVQIAQGEVEALVGSDEVESLDLSDGGETVLIDALRQSETEELWRFSDDEPVVGVGVIVRYDPDADEYSSTALSLAEARGAISFEDAEGDGKQQQEE